jgi:ABC-type methionine transport system permease subunit
MMERAIYETAIVFVGMTLGLLIGILIGRMQIIQQKQEKKKRKICRQKLIDDINAACSGLKKE